MISATGNACALSTNPIKIVHGPDGPRESDQNTCASTQSPVKLSHAEITAITKTTNYLNGINGEKDFRRMGIESQCNGIAIVKNTRTTVLPKLTSGETQYWYYSCNHKDQTYHDELPPEVLLKGQILARTEQTAAGAPLMALTAEMGRSSKLARIYYPELITAPLTRQEFAQANIQASLDHFRTLFTNHLTQTKMYSLSEVIATYNNTRPSNVLELIIEDQVPQNINSHFPAGRPADYSFYTAPLPASFWWTQSNFAIPFKNIKNLHQVLDDHKLTETIINDICCGGAFKKHFVEPLQKNQLTDAWLWHFLYLAVPFGFNLGPLNAENSRLRLPKFYQLNVRYSHHQLMMEILDEEGIDLLSETIFSIEFNKSLFVNTIRRTINDYHKRTCKLKPVKQNPVFDSWLWNYLDDMINLCNIRKKHGASTVYNANTNQPFILVDNQAHYLPFKLLTSFQGLHDGYYRSVLPTYTNDRGEPCTVLERREFSKKSHSVIHGIHYPFTAKSKWYSDPTEEEQRHLNLYWA